MATNVTADQLRRGRDLADQDAALQAEKDGLIFKETSPRPEPITLYLMSDGEPIPMAPHIAEMAIKKKFRSGAYMFTDKPEEAPVYKLGNVKCFLHPDSVERELLNEVGLQATFCYSEHLASLYSKRVHAQGRHKLEWATLQEYKGEQEREEERRERREQIDATMALAGTAAKKQPAKKPEEGAT